MFPNVRLMIAAVVASVVTLSCGFGVFAAFRVNHEPLVRLVAPLQLIADHTVAASVIAAAEPFDHRFQIRPPPSAGRPMEPPTPGRDDRDGAAPAPAPSVAAPERGAADEAEATAAVTPSTESAALPAAPVVPPTAVLLTNTVAPTADDHAPGAAEPAPAPDTAHADAAPSSHDTPAVAAIAPRTDQAPPVEQKPDSELAPASVTKAVEIVAHKPDRKAATRTRHTRTRVVAGVSRARTRAYTVAPFDGQYRNRDTAFSQSDFQTSSRQLGRSKDNSRPPEDTTAVANVPFVSPPGR